MEGQQSEGHPVSDNEEKPIQPTNADVAVTKSPRKGKMTVKRKSIAHPKEKQTVDPSWDQQNAEKTAEEQQTKEPFTRRLPRTRSGVQSTAQTAQRNGKRKRPEQPETHTVTEPTPLPKFIDDEARERWLGDNHDFCQQATFVAKMNLLVPPTPSENENAHRKEPRTEPTTKTTPEYLASSSQPQDKEKAPVTEEEDDDDGDEDTDEEDPAQFRLTRRRPGFSKFTF
nr:transcription initiation factor TFIID subunit 11-like [Coffea arabica]